MINHGKILIIRFFTFFLIGWLASSYYSEPEGIVQDRMPNETNYNLNMIASEKIEATSLQRAKELIKKLEDGDLSTLGHRDFYVLRAKAKLAE